MADPRFDKRKPAPTGEQQRVQAAITAGVEKALVEAMRPMIESEPCKLVRAFQKHEIGALAVAAISAYVTARGQAEQNFVLAMELNDPIDDLWRP